MPRLPWLRNKIYLLLVLFAVSSGSFCGCKNRNHSANAASLPIEIPESEAQFRQTLSGILEQYMPTLQKDKHEDTSRYIGWQLVLQDIYQAQSFQPVWVSKDILSSKGKELYDFINSAEYFGLNKELYAVARMNFLFDSMQKAAPAINYDMAKELEVGLTRIFCEMALHLDQGMFADSIQGINTNFLTTKARYTDLVGHIVAGQSVDSTLHSLEPRNPIYQRYMQALKEFVSKHNISMDPIHIRDPKIDSAGAYADARQALVVHHYLPDSLLQNDSAFKSALLQFQKDNGLNTDGKIGLMTQKALERGDAAKFQLLAINADRWRKESLTLPERYVWVNLAATKLRIIERDSLKLEKNVVIGKADTKHKTPTLESGINQVVLWPTWTVPQSIVKHELKSFKGYIVTKTGNYTQVVQPPGPNNSLGVVKILFPNKYSVYLHDTPSKYLFKSDYRAHSHGCVRCQDALEVAAYLMRMDTFQITYDSLLALKNREVTTQTFRFKRSIPLFFKYFTAEVDWNGKLHFYTDIYKRDSEMIEFIFGRKKPAATKPASPKAKVKDSLEPWQNIPVVENPAKDTTRTSG